MSVNKNSKESQVEAATCPVCRDHTFEWAAKQPVWGAETCWNHLNYNEKKKWFHTFFEHLQTYQGLHIPETDDDSHVWDAFFALNVNKFKSLRFRKEKIKKRSAEELRHLSPLLYAEWIAYRNKNLRTIKPLNHPIFNLANVDLSNQNLSGLNLDGAILTEANLENANLSSTSLRFVNFHKANLLCSCLKRSEIITSDITEACLRKAKMEHVQILNSNINNAKLSSALLTFAIIDNCSFLRADLESCIAISSKFHKCDLTEANIDRANFSGSQIQGAILKHTSGKQALFVQANLEKAQLEEGNFCQAVFDNANLCSANLKAARFQNASFTNADLQGIEVNETDLRQADLRGADLINVSLHMANCYQTKIFQEDMRYANIFMKQAKDESFSIIRKNKVRVFISYSHADSSFAVRLEKALKKRSVDVWIDRKEILVGESLIGRIREGIDSSKFVCAVLSQQSLQSQWVKNELDIAMNQQIESGSVKVFPLVLEKDIELPSFLIGKLYVDFSTEESFKNGIDQIIRAIDRVDY